MTQVARIFVVLNLLIAAGFLFAAATFLGTNNDYKNKFAAEQVARKADNTRNEVSIQKLGDTIKDQATQIGAAKEKIGNLEGVTVTQRSTISGHESQAAVKDGQIAEATRVSSEHATTGQRLQSENQKLVEANQSLDRAQRDAVKKQGEAETSLAAALADGVAKANTIAEGERAMQKQADKIKELDLMVGAAVARGFNVSDLVVMPAVTGSVINADNATKLVMANVGSAQGVVKGGMLEISRGATYIGRFMVDSVSSSSCAGIIKLMKSGEQVMVGDRVTTQLN